MRCARWLCLLPLLLPCLPAAAETIWLRGRGSEVWIERDGRVQPPQKDRKGFSRVSSPSPVVLRERGRRAATARPAAVVVERPVPVYWSEPRVVYVDDDVVRPRYRYHYVHAGRSHHRHARALHSGRHHFGRDHDGRARHVRDAWGRASGVGHRFEGPRARGGRHR